MNKNISPTLFIVLALAGILSLTACGASTPEPTATIDVAPIQTDAVSTFAAGLTQTAFLQPTETPTSTLDAHPVLQLPRAAPRSRLRAASSRPPPVTDSSS